MTLIDAAFDLFFRPFRDSNPAYAIAAISFLTGLVTLLTFRYASNQVTMRRIKDRIQAHVLEVRLFPDQLSVVWRAYGQVMRFTLSYLAQSLKPLLILLVPMIVLMAQLDLRFSRTPLRPGDSFLLKVKLTEPQTLDANALRLPEGLTLTAPPLNIRALREVDWRIRADRRGDFAPAVVTAGQAFTKQVVVSGSTTRLSPERARASMEEWLLDPGEKALPRNGPLETLEVNYAPRSIDLGLFQTEWWVLFLVVSLVSALVLKIVLRIEI